jgi:hypothetical protein
MLPSRPTARAWAPADIPQRGVWRPTLSSSTLPQLNCHFAAEREIFAADAPPAALDAWAWQLGQAYDWLPSAGWQRPHAIDAKVNQACGQLRQLGPHAFVFGIVLLSARKLPWRWTRSKIHEHRLPGHRAKPAAAHGPRAAK